jgi:hemolysin activation/secretion protein
MILRLHSAVLLAFIARAALAQQHSVETTSQPTTAPTIQTLQGVIFEWDVNPHPAPITAVALQQAIQPLIGRELDQQLLDDLQLAVQDLYARQGYVLWGTTFPTQEVKGGVVKLRIHEGWLAKTKILGKPRLRKRYLLERINPGTRPPLSTSRLDRQLSLLSKNPNIASVNIGWEFGERHGESILLVDVQETSPWTVDLTVNNSRPPSVGEQQVELGIANTNVLGWSDQLSFRYGFLKGGFEDPEPSSFDDFTLRYEVPVTASDTALQFLFSRTDVPVVEDQFADLVIESESSIAELMLGQPLYRSAYTSSTAYFGIGYHDSRTSLQGDPFSLSPGAVDGQSTVTLLRVGHRLEMSRSWGNLTIDSGLDIGAPTLDASVNSDHEVPDGRYVSWITSASYERELDRRGDQLVIRLTSQVADDPLLSMEQFSLGGRATVRGYRENSRVRDNGVAASAELHLPIIRRDVARLQGRELFVQAVPFFDIGRAWNVNEDRDEPGSDDPETLASVGCGFQVNLHRLLTAEVYYGYALRETTITGDKSLQDYGIHFNLRFLLY